MMIPTWLVIAIVAAIIEIVTPFFGFVLVTAAALLAALAAALHLPPSGQIVVFGVSLVVFLVLIRPWVVARLTARGVPSRTDRLTGETGQVTEAVDPVLGTGRVTVAGQDWAARSHTSLPVGSHVIVEGADGIVLRVRSAEVSSESAATRG